MSALSFHRKCRAQGRCIRCGEHHDRMNAKTGLRCWYCEDCTEQRKRDRRYGSAEQAARRRRRLMLAETASPVVPLKATHRTIYSQHDAVVATYFWRSAVSR